MTTQALPENEHFRVLFITRDGDQQEGPLGLLWKLIESYEVDIFEVSLTKITGDFISYIQNSSVELAEETEFALMASRLLFYKSRLLLPNPSMEMETEQDRLPLELIDLLLEYKKFQLAAETLRNLEETASTVLTRETSWNEFEEGIDLLEVDLKSFLITFREFLLRAEKARPMEIEEELISMDEVLEKFREDLRANGTLMFLQYVEGETILRIVITFLAVLELAKLKFITIMQSTAFGDIELVYTGNESGQELY